MYEASIENWGDSRSFATTRHSSFAMDTQGKGANPVDTLLAGLCGCLGHYVRDFFHEQAIPLARFAVLAEAEATPDQSRLASISVLIDIGDADLDAEREPQLLAFVERCKVYGTLRRGCPIEVVLQRRDGAARARSSPVERPAAMTHAAG